ncbi:MAG: hypothetical protein N4A45_06925 [Flavobacteriales bacterium]|jgi:hypothetical protein|nr:hypothetical protein [Flavobacteriales bacterium]
MTFEKQILVVFSVLCMTIILFLLYRKRKSSEYQFIALQMLLTSVIWLTIALAFLGSKYFSYVDLVDRVDRERSTENIPKKCKFTESEFDIIEELFRAKKNLIGYSAFIEESALSFDPEDFSFEESFLENDILKFENKEYSLEYWKEVDSIVNSIYTGNNPYYLERSNSYFPITIVPSSDDSKNAFVSQNDIVFHNLEDYEYKSKIKYIQRKIRNFDRSASSITELWETNRGYIYAVVSKSKYNLVAKMIDDLIVIYDRIIQEPNYREFYQAHNIYIDSVGSQHTYNNIVFLSYPTYEFVDSFDSYWGFGFWDRRFTEKNDQAVYKILKEIQKHYND